MWPHVVEVLPPSFANDPDRLARFGREARLLAALNHPNIATIHGIEETDGVHGLVMELVEGPTLSDKLTEHAQRSTTAGSTDPHARRRSMPFRSQRHSRPLTKRA